MSFDESSQSGAVLMYAFFKLNRKNPKWSAKWRALMYALSIDGRRKQRKGAALCVGGGGGGDDGVGFMVIIHPYSR